MAVCSEPWIWGLQVWFPFMLQLSPENAEEYIEYLHSIDRLDEAAVRLAAVVNDERFVSKEGKSNYQVDFGSRQSCLPSRIAYQISFVCMCFLCLSEAFLSIASNCLALWASFCSYGTSSVISSLKTQTR